jgi:hypothetical protein
VSFEKRRAPSEAVKSKSLRQELQNNKKQANRQGLIFQDLSF